MNSFITVFVLAAVASAHADMDAGFCMDHQTTGTICLAGKINLSARYFNPSCKDNVYDGLYENTVYI